MTIIIVTEKEDYSIFKEFTILITDNTSSKESKSNTQLDKYYLEETSKDVKNIAKQFVGNFKNANKTADNSNSRFDISYKKNVQLKQASRYKAPRAKIKFNRTKKVLNKLYNATYGIRHLFKSIINAIKRKGNHERSILIFYDDEEHGVRLPINNFMILFLILVFFCIDLYRI